jgi:glycopeptide antibiotics resistance protein
VRTIRVGKGLQGVFLVTYSCVLLGVTLLVQGGGKVRTNLAPFEDVQRLAARASRGGYLSNAFLYAILGIAGNLAMFAVWAFLLWKFLDGPGRAALRNHMDTLLAGTLFSVGIETVQLFLPTRAADVNDVFWNVLGTIAGCTLAHVHRNVRLDWQ